MRRDIDYMELKKGEDGDLDIECIKHSVIDPLRALTMVICDYSSELDGSQVEPLSLILHEKILEVAEQIDKLYEQKTGKAKGEK